MIQDTCGPAFFGGMYNSTWSENKINPILSLFCVAESHSGGNLGNIFLNWLFRAKILPT
jgi:hypothetical protein